MIIHNYKRNFQLLIVKREINKYDSHKGKTKSNRHMANFKLITTFNSNNIQILLIPIQSFKKRVFTPLLRHPNYFCSRSSP